MHIEQLEYEVWRLRGELNKLRASESQMDCHLYQDRLNRLASELNYMQEEITRMKIENVDSPPVPQKEIPEIALTASTNHIPEFNRNMPKQPFVKNIPFPKKTMDLEKTFGTGIMGIVASALIFISIIIFGGMIIPFLSQGMMAFLMFLVSFAIAGTGLALLKKNQTNKFNLSLCACGVVAICISLFVTRVIFGFIDNIIFLVLMSVWMAWMGYLCKKYHYMFRIIGEIGMLMASILGIAELCAYANLTSYIILILVCGTAFAIYHYNNPRIDYVRNGCSHVIHTIALLVFSCPLFMSDMPKSQQIIAFAFLLGLFVLEFVMAWKEDLKNGIFFYILTALQILIFAGCLYSFDETSSFAFLFAAAILLAPYMEKKQTAYPFIGEILLCSAYIIGSIGICDEIYAITSLVCVIPLFAYGYFRNKNICLYAGLIGFIYTTNNHLFMEGEGFGFIQFICVFILPFIAFVFVAQNRVGERFSPLPAAQPARLLSGIFPLRGPLHKADSLFNAIGYAICMYCLACGVNALCSPAEMSYAMNNAIIFYVISIVHLAIIKGRILKDESRTFEIGQSVVTFALMMSGSHLLAGYYEPKLTAAYTFFVVIALFALFSINSVRLLKKSELWGYYIALKYTFFMWITLGTVCDINIIFSIALLLFAFGSIVGGFTLRHKSFRIYGLMLSMISIFKLVLFDIKGKRMASNALSFLACGIICFGISFVYNKIEHKVKQTENENQSGQETGLI